jgi:hypothetical protein
MERLIKQQEQGTTTTSATTTADDGDIDDNYCVGADISGNEMRSGNEGENLLGWDELPNTNVLSVQTQQYAVVLLLIFDGKK